MGKGLSPLTIYRRNTMDCQDSQQRNTPLFTQEYTFTPSQECDQNQVTWEVYRT